MLGHTLQLVAPDVWLKKSLAITESFKDSHASNARVYVLSGHVLQADERLWLV